VNRKQLKSLAATLTLAAATAAVPSRGDTYTIDRSHSEAAFQTRHLVTKLRGRFSDFAGTIRLDPGQPETSSVEFTIQAGSIDTANPDRDRHLRSADFFDAEKHPQITFKSKEIRAAGKDRYDVRGTLEIRGIAKDITVPVRFLGFAKDPWGNEKAGFEVELTLNRKDFGMVWNKSLDNGGLLLADEVQVSINLETVKAKTVAAR
jgi:polyisoprenoid-binding protein YceI